MGHFVTGVTVVTTLTESGPHGITVNALTSVSLEPPLVMVALDRRRFITPSVRLTGRFAVNVLSEDQQALSDCFAGAPVQPGRDAFCGASWTPGTTGLPLVEGAIATIECTVVQTFEAGDHELFIGRVDAMANVEPHPMPLLVLPPPIPPDPARRGVPARGRPGALGALTAVPTVRANDLDIAYEVHGAGPPLVMLHGATSIGREDFAAADPAPLEGVPAVPARRSRPRPDAWDAAAGSATTGLSRTSPRSSTRSGLETFHLLGFSMGAMTALQYAAALRSGCGRW